MSRVHFPTTLVSLAVMVSLAGCGSTTVEFNDGPVNLTGTYFGFQSGTRGVVEFSNEEIELRIVTHNLTNDSLIGSWATAGSAGSFLGARDPASEAFEFDMVFRQEIPCEATFAVRGEARTGRLPGGDLTIGISGEYGGPDCDGQLDAEFFVELAS